jgi:hypothetical protein
MPDRPSLYEPTGDQGAAQFRADLTAYLDSLFLHELAELLGELSEPTRVALMHELSECGPAWAKLPEDWPQLPRRSLRERLGDRRAARRRPVPEQLRRWQAEAERVADQLARQRRTGAVAERRVAEALRAWATSRDPAEQRQQREDPPAARPPRSRDWPGPDPRTAATAATTTEPASTTQGASAWCQALTGGGGHRGRQLADRLAGASTWPSSDSIRTAPFSKTPLWSGVGGQDRALPRHRDAPFHASQRTPCSLVAKARPPEDSSTTISRRSSTPRARRGPRWPGQPAPPQSRSFLSMGSHALALAAATSPTASPSSG